MQVGPRNDDELNSETKGLAIGNYPQLAAAHIAHAGKFISKISNNDD